MKKTLTTIAMLAIFIPAAIAAESTADDGPVKRSNHYIDDTSEASQSGWKAMISNAYPHTVQANGRWFAPAPIPRPFRLSERMTPFSNEMRSRLRDNSTDGLIVVKDGVIVRQYFRFGFDVDDIHQVHSVGKVFTSFAIQPVYDRIGSDGLNRRLEEYLPRLQGKFFGQSTLAQALDMKNGMEWTENYEDPTTATMISFSVSGLEPFDPEKGPESWYDRMFDFPKYGEHGKTWVYNNSSVLAASFAAAAIAERHFSALVQDSYEALGFEDRSWYTANQFHELSAEGGKPSPFGISPSWGAICLMPKVQAMSMMSGTKRRIPMIQQMQYSFRSMGRCSAPMGIQITGIELVPIPSWASARAESFYTSTGART